MADKKQQKYVNNWISKTLDRVNLTMPKGEKDIIRSHAQSRGESLNAFINRAIKETMERDLSDAEDNSKQKSLPKR